VIYSITHGQEILSVPAWQFQFRLNDLEKKTHFVRVRIVLILPRAVELKDLRLWFSITRIDRLSLVDRVESSHCEELSRHWV
jgi:hypothetical protein